MYQSAFWNVLRSTTRSKMGRRPASGECQNCWLHSRMSAVGRLCCKSRRETSVELDFETIESVFTDSLRSCNHRHRRERSQPLSKAGIVYDEDSWRASFKREPPAYKRQLVLPFAFAGCAFGF